MPRQRTTASATAQRRGLLGAVAVVVVAAAAAVSSVEAFAFPRPQAAGMLAARRAAAIARARVAPRMSTKDDVDSGAKAPSMPFASAPLQVDKSAAAPAQGKGRAKPGESLSHRTPRPQSPPARQRGSNGSN